MRFAVVTGFVAACGRLGFEGHSANDASPRDGASDAMTIVDGDAGGGCPAFALFCDDFESGSLTKWSGEDSPNNQAVTTGAKYTGTYGLDSIVPADMGAGAEGDVYIIRPGNSAFSIGKLAVREWVYSPAQLVSYTGTLEVTLGPPATAMQYIEVDADDNSEWSISEFGSAGLHDHAGTIAAQTATWTCVELVIELGSNASASVFVDGSASLSGQLANGGQSYDTIAVGVTRANAGGFEVYIDDVVIATQRIGC